MTQSPRVSVDEIAAVAGWPDAIPWYTSVLTAGRYDLQPDWAGRASVALDDAARALDYVRRHPPGSTAAVRPEPSMVVRAIYDGIRHRWVPGSSRPGGEDLAEVS